VSVHRVETIRVTFGTYTAEGVCRDRPVPSIAAHHNRRYKTRPRHAPYPRRTTQALNDTGDVCRHTTPTNARPATSPTRPGHPNRANRTSPTSTGRLTGQNRASSTSSRPVFRTVHRAA
jgi:hypothetical protein